nr:hypothetical protein GCM10020093_031860 [Planobispora longispora]
MIVATVLVLYAIAAVGRLPRLLGRGTWAERAPRLAISIWLAACVSAVASVALAAFAAAIPASVVGHGLAAFFEACAALLSDGDLALSPGARAALLGAVLVVARVTHCGAAVLVRARRERRRHADLLAVLGRHDGGLGAVVLEHDEAAAYCLPGRQGKTVITTAALESLAPEQVAAVLAHERAHLRGRHHLVLAAVEAFSVAFPVCRCSPAPETRWRVWSSCSPTMWRPVTIRASTSPPRWYGWPPAGPRLHAGRGRRDGAHARQAHAGPRRPPRPQGAAGRAGNGGPAACGARGRRGDPGVSSLLAHHCHTLSIF